ncbi:MAG: iron-containing redox enzyme family protein [Gammaproteobacteria bacterium]
MELRTLQEQISNRLLRTRGVQELMQGQISVGQYRAYLQDVYSYALHSSVVIGWAANRMVHSHPPLADYLFRHAGEELGHDQWAASDLRDLGMTDAEIVLIRPSTPCARMVGLEYYYAAHANPVGLFGWMFVLESLGGKVGGGIATAIDKVLSLNGRATYFLKGHADADAHHAEELYAVISKHVVAKNDQQDFQSMVLESEDLYCAMLDSAYGGLATAAA